MPGIVFVMPRPFHWWSLWLAWLFCETENKFGTPDRFHWIEREMCLASRILDLGPKTPDAGPETLNL